MNAAAILLALVLGSSATVNGVAVRRATLFGYEVAGLPGALSLEEALVAVEPPPPPAAMWPANDTTAPTLVARGEVSLFGVAFAYEWLGRPGYYRLTHGHGRSQRVVLTHPGTRAGAIVAEEVSAGPAKGRSVAWLTLGVRGGRLEVVR